MNYVGPSSAVPELTKPGWRMRRINVTKQVLVTPALIPPLKVLMPGPIQMIRACLSQIVTLVSHYQSLLVTLCAVYRRE